MPGVVLALDQTAPPAKAASGSDAKSQVQAGVDAVGGEDDTRDLNTTVKTVINVLLFVVGILAVVMIVYSGARYIASGGDQNKVASAKNTLVFSVVGLVIAILAYAIVNWVFDRLQ